MSTVCFNKTRLLKIKSHLERVQVRQAQGGGEVLGGPLTGTRIGTGRGVE